MRHGKFRERLLMILEVGLLVVMVLLSFYLLYCSVQEGELKDTMGETDHGGDLENEPADKSAQEVQTALVYRMEEGENRIRVRILNTDHTEGWFEEIHIMGSEGLSLERGTYGEDYAFTAVSAQPGNGEETEAEPMEDEDADAGGGKIDVRYFAAEEICEILQSDLEVGEVLHVMPDAAGTLTVTNLERAYGAPEYAGEFYIYRLADGLALVNVLELEEYLYSVVPSEMPSYYPAEAQKAQAVCARTYAWLCMEQSKNEKSIADLDDSVAFQVYNNRKSTQASQEAVDATCGELLAVEEVRYYSTSCLSEEQGDLSDETAFREFLAKEPGEDEEYGSAWLRWQVEIPVSQILQTLLDDYAIEADTLDGIEIETRNSNGQVQILKLQAGGAALEIEGEYAIRKFLSPQDADVELRDGSVVSGMQMLPSAFFYVEADETVLYIAGGGYGHGNGMSQCGAAKMAQEGATYLEILDYYFGKQKSDA